MLTLHLSEFEKRSAKDSAKWSTLHDVRRFTKNKRTAGCAERAVNCGLRADYALISRATSRDASKHGACRFDNLNMCGSAWSCPVCGPAKASKWQTRTLAGMISGMRRGFIPALMTSTAPHTWRDSLAASESLISRANAGLFGAGRNRKRWRERWGVVGYLRAFDVTVGPRGWHPHYHTLVWFDRTMVPTVMSSTAMHQDRVARNNWGRPWPDEPQVELALGDERAPLAAADMWAEETVCPLFLERFQAEMRGRWGAKIQALSGREIHPVHGLQVEAVRSREDMATYLAKVCGPMSMEVTLAHRKSRYRDDDPNGWLPVAGPAPSSAPVVVQKAVKYWPPVAGWRDVAASMPSEFKQKAQRGRTPVELRDSIIAGLVAMDEAASDGDDELAADTYAILKPLIAVYHEYEKHMKGKHACRPSHNLFRALGLYDRLLGSETEPRNMTLDEMEELIAEHTPHKEVPHPVEWAPRLKIPSWLFDQVATSQAQRFVLDVLEADGEAAAYLTERCDEYERIWDGGRGSAGTTVVIRRGDEMPPMRLGRTAHRHMLHQLDARANSVFGNLCAVTIKLVPLREWQGIVREMLPMWGRDVEARKATRLASSHNERVTV